MSRVALFEAISTIVGCVVGAGVLAIPYVVSQSGFFIGMIHLLVIGAAMLFIYLSLGEVVLRTNGKHQLTGYAEKYLGTWGKRAMLFSMIFGMYGALTAYLLGEGNAIKAIFGGSALWYTLGYFVIVATIVYIGLEAVERSEFLAFFIVAFIVVAIVILSLPKISLANLSTINPGSMFVPYGVILFAYMGLIAVPEAREILIHEKEKLKKAILIGVAIPFVIYSIFTLAVVGVVSASQFSALDQGERIATVALGIVLGTKAAVFVNIFAIFAMFTSFIGIGLALKDMFIYDYLMHKTVAWALTCFIPLGIALSITLSGFTNFIDVIGISGIVAGGVEGVVIVLMARAAKRKSERDPEYSMPMRWWIAIPLIAFFVLGVAHLGIEAVLNLLG